ncbi:MAG: hypothetical protein KKH28_00785 [Elusimicrobia bacterium]|nr:hypothetical protein [Elusimicrobiota bacterium]
MIEPVSRYFAYTKKSIKGPFYPKDIAQLPGFGRNTLVCTETTLGQWREAYLEKAFELYLGSLAQDPQKPRLPLTHASAEDTAVRSLLEKAILKNSQLETEVKSMKREYAHEKNKFEEEGKKKGLEIKALAERLKRTSEAQSLQGEHPSWEQLYKTIKKRTGEKLFEATQELSEKKEEILRLRSQMQNMVDNYEDSKRRLQEAARKETADADAQFKELRSEAEEQEMVIKTLTENIQSTLNKNEEFQSIMLDERKDHEEQNKKFCEEIGTLRADIKWKQQELDRLKTDLFDAFNKMKELESLDGLRMKKQEELYGAVHAKIKTLSGYFENLEAKLKYAFKKA